LKLWPSWAKGSDGGFSSPVSQSLDAMVTATTGDSMFSYASNDIVKATS